MLYAKWKIKENEWYLYGFDTVKIKLIKLIYGFGRKVHSISLSKSRHDFVLLKLIINNWDLLSILVLELFSIDGVSDGDCQRSREQLRWDYNKLNSSSQHSSINNFFIFWFKIFAFFRDFMVFTQHTVFGDSVVTESQVAIVFWLIPIFRAYVPNDDSWKRFICLHISDRDNKSLDPLWFLVNDEFSENQSIVTKETHIAWPKFVSRNRGWVNHKLLRFFVKNCSCFKVLHIWSVS